MTVNPRVLVSSIFKQAKDVLLNRINNLAKQKLDAAIQELIREIEDHPVSKELYQKQSISESDFLSGRRGNLFSFLGFNATQNPVDELILFLNNSIDFIPANNITIRGLIGHSQPRASVPTREDFKFLHLSWEPGRSWVYAIEEGVNNLGYYLFVKSAESRSGKGIQSEHLVKAAQFTPVQYITPILERFRKQLNPSA